MSHHQDDDDDDKAVDSTAAKMAGDDDRTPEQDGDDVEGHSLLTMSDAFVKSRMPNKADLERDARRQAELREARRNQRG